MHVSIALAATIVVAYVAALIGLNRRNKPRLGTRANGDLKPLAYALSLTTLASGWMLFAAVGDAARQGGAILGLFAGPMLAPVVFTPIWRKLRLVARQQQTTSLADFLGARYGRSQAVAAVVAVTVALVVIGLLVMQIETLATSFAVLVEGAPPAGAGFVRAAPWRDPVLILVVLVFLVMTTLPGRYVDSAGNAPRMARLVVVGSALMLLMFTILALFAAYQLKFGGGLNHDAVQNMSVSGVVFSQPLLTPHFVAVLLLAACATLCLPRLFQFGVVGARDRRGSMMARWILPLFMLWLAVAAMIVTTAGLSAFDSTVVNPDRFPIALPLALGHPGFALIAFASVLAASVSALIVATAFAASMLTNELILPLWEYIRPSDHAVRALTTTRLVRIERLWSAILLLMAWGGYRLIKPWHGLAEPGLVALAGVALFIPPLIGALYIPNVKYRGVIAGLCGGVAMWLYTLVLPALGLLAANGSFLPMGEPAVSWLAPHALLGVSFHDTLSHGLFWMVFVETIVMLAVSFNTRASLIERAQASAFIDPRRSQRDRTTTRSLKTPNIRVAELEVLLRRFLGDQVARETIDEYAGNHDHDLLSRQLADSGMVRFAESRLAGVVGASAARWLLSSGSSRGDIGFDEVARVLDRTADAVQFNRGVLRAALENSDQGISVIDADLRLITWNSRYLTLFDYPDGFVRSGRHIADLIRYNAMRGECGPGRIEDHVERRLEHLKRAQPHRFERHRRDGTILHMTGNPIPGGGFVTTFNDITEFKTKQAELARANARLEARVAERTAALSRSNEQLINENRQRARAEHGAENARRTAELANQSKSRFLAAASHDLLQPLNAARLFAEATGNRGPLNKTTDAIGQIRLALDSAQNLLEPLLDISKLDSGQWPVNVETVRLDRLLAPLAGQFRVIARDAGLALHYVPSTASIDTDPALLARVIQNLISNAVRYTRRGRVLLGVRREPAHVRIQVWDTGPGITEHQKTVIFEEFQRGDATTDDGDRGLGLGLSLADRLCRLLGHELTLSSVPGVGTGFSVRVALAEAPALDSVQSGCEPGVITIEQALCIDDDPASRDGMVNTLEGWSIDTLTAEPADAGSILADGVVDIALIDYDLGNKEDNGLALIERCRPVADIRYVLVTANRGADIAARAADAGVRIVYKPVMASELRAALGLDAEVEALNSTAGSGLR